MPRSLKIATKLALSFILVVIITMGGMGYFSYSKYKDVVLKKHFDNLFLLSEIKRTDVYNFIERAKGRAIDFSSDGFIRDASASLIKKDSVDLRKKLLEHLIKNKMGLDAAIQGINITDLSGRVIASSDEREIGGNEGIHPNFSRLADLKYGEANAMYVDISHHFGIKTPSIAIIAPLTDKSTGEKIGAIINYVGTEELNAVLRRQPVGLNRAAQDFFEQRKTLEGYVVDEKNILITELRYRKDAAFKTSVATEPVMRCRDGIETAGVYSNYQGIRVFGASNCLSNGWTLIIEISEQEVFNELAPLRSALINSFIVIFLTAFLISYLLSRQIVNPIVKLTEVAKEIQSGNLAARADIKQNDEIGILVDTINAMTQKLADAQTNLEKKVVERTADLQKFKLAVENASD